jgi:hypothetical protein
MKVHVCVAAALALLAPHAGAQTPVPLTPTRNVIPKTCEEMEGVAHRLDWIEGWRIRAEEDHRHAAIRAIP